MDDSEVVPSDGYKWVIAPVVVLAISLPVTAPNAPETLI
jgi:hypothetical protein